MEHQNHFVVLSGLCIGVICVTAVGNVQAQVEITDSKKRIAVQEFAARGVRVEVAANVADVVAAALAQVGTYAVISKNDIAAMVGFEAQKQLIGCLDAACISEIGNALGVDYIVTGAVGRLGDSFSLSVSMIDIASGKAFGRAQEQVGDLTQLPQAARRAVATMLGKKTPLRELTGNGGLFVSTAPEGAQVYVDGALQKDPTPLTIDPLPAGDHMVKVVRGKLKRTVPILVEPDKIAKIHLTMAVVRAKFMSVPFDATVFVDGIERGKTPLLIAHVPAERHRVEFRKHGYRPHVEEVIFELTRFRRAGGEAFEVHATLKPIPVVVEVKSSPKGASVFVDGDLEGETPAVVQAVIPGEHILSVSLNGYRTHEQKLVVRAGKMASASVQLDELVVHRDYVEHTTFRRLLTRYGLIGGGSAVAIGAAMSIWGWSDQGKAQDRWDDYSHEIDPARISRRRNKATSLNDSARLKTDIGYSLMTVGSAALIGVLVNYFLMPPEPDYDESGELVPRISVAARSADPLPDAAMPVSSIEEVTQ